MKSYWGCGPTWLSFEVWDLAIPELLREVLAMGNSNPGNPI